MKLLPALARCVSVILIPLPSLAYEDVTHIRMTLGAIAISKIGQGEIFSKWDLNSFSFPYSGGGQAVFVDLITQGSVDEDVPDPRVLAHFYDPKNNQALSFCGLLPLGAKSPDWAINGIGQLDNPHFRMQTLEWPCAMV